MLLVEVTTIMAIVEKPAVFQVESSSTKLVVMKYPHGVEQQDKRNTTAKARTTPDVPSTPSNKVNNNTCRTSTEQRYGVTRERTTAMR